MKEKRNIKKKVFVIPQNQEELIEFLKALNQAARRKDSVESKIKEKQEEIERIFAGENKHLDGIIEGMAEGIYLYCQLHRDALTHDNKKKTVTLPGGTVLWRFNPPSVYVKNEKLAVEALEQEGLDQLVRTKKEINKETILAQPDLIATNKYIKVRLGNEVFAIKPADVKYELERGDKKIKKKESRKGKSWSISVVLLKK